LVEKQGLGHSYVVPAEFLSRGVSRLSGVARVSRYTTSKACQCLVFPIIVRLASPSPTLHRKVGEGAQYDKISNTIIFYLEIGFIS
jgi:hypothetical protein